MPIQQYYDSGDNTQIKITTDAGQSTPAQTFTPLENFALASVRLKLYRTNLADSNHDVKVRVYQCDGDGHPLTYLGPSDAILDSSITTDTDGEWAQFDFSTPINLVANIKYSLSILIGTGLNLYWREDSVAATYGRGNVEQRSGGVWSATPAGADLLFETWSGTPTDVRTYTLRGVTDDKGRPIAEAWCRAYNSSDQTNLVLVETRYTNEYGIAEFRFLPDDAPVDIEVIWGSHVVWYRNVFNVDGSSIEDVVDKAHTQNTDTKLTTDGSTALIDSGTLKTNLACDAGVTIDGVDVGDHSARHESGGADAIKLDDLSAPDDNTDLNFSTSKHGLVPKGTNVGHYLKDDGSWADPGGYPHWKINSGETVTVGERREYAIASGTLEMAGILSLGADANLIVFNGGA